MKVLLVQTSFIGDVVLSTPVITNLRTLYPDAEIVTLTTPIAEELWKFHPAVSKTLVFDKRGCDAGVRGFLRMAQMLRAEKFDIVFSLHKSLRTSLLLLAAGIPLRYGFSEAVGSFLYSQTKPRSEFSHDVLRNLAIFRVLGREPGDLNQRLEIFRPETVKREVTAMLGGQAKPLLGLAPGSVWPTKRWTPEGFAEVANEYSKRGYQVVLIGGPMDRASADDVLKLSDGSILDLVGKTTLLQSVELVSRCAALVTNDSAPLHFASACDVPVAAVFCATIPEFGFGPWQVRSECIGLDELTCRPCGRHGGKTCPTGTHACQLQVKSKIVIAAVERLTAEPAAQVRRVG